MESRFGYLPVRCEEGGWECPLCSRKFGQKSSCVRHLKRCSQNTAPLPRQKSCKHCASAKTRCDLQRPSCARCISRNVRCEYLLPPGGKHTPEQYDSSKQYEPLRQPPDQLQNNQDLSDISFNTTPIDDTTVCPFIDMMPTPRTLSPPCATLDPDLTFNTPSVAGYIPGSTFTFLQNEIDDTPPDSTHQIIPDHVFDSMHERWLMNFVPGHQEPRKLSGSLHGMNLVFRIFKTWPRMLARREQIPPFIHASQMTSEGMKLPLANCVRLAKMWDGGQDAQTSVMVAGFVRKEVLKLYSEHKTYDPQTLLATIQALLLYTIILLFPHHGSGPAPLPPDTFLQLQQVCMAVGKTGLLLRSERTSQRPEQTLWNEVEARRRTICALYMFDWAYCVLQGSPKFQCEELGGVPMPASKALWQARSSEEWEGIYLKRLARWKGAPMLMAEFTELGSEYPEERLEMWVEEADEFGIIMTALGTCSATIPNVIDDSEPLGGGRGFIEMC